MGRSGSRFLDHWHDRRIELPDGDTLLYVQMDEPAPPRLECARTVRRGAITREEAHGWLVELGHADAGLRVPSAAPLGPGAVR